MLNFVLCFFLKSQQNFYTVSSRVMIKKIKLSFEGWYRPYSKSTDDDKNTFHAQLER